MSTKRYQPGEKFANVHELCQWILDGKPVWLSGRAQNAAFMQNQQLHTLVNIARVARKAVSP